jgi:hypothetical protein
MIANDVLNAVSYRVLIEPVVNTTLGTVVPSAGSFTVSPPSMAGIYNGALLICGSGATQEVVTVTTVTTFTFTAVFAYPHAATDPLYGATFPTGQFGGDILFTQAEMLGYLSDALLDFTMKTWPIYNIVQSQFLTGVRAYTTPSDAIRIERISRQNTPRITTTLGTAVTGGPNLQTVAPGSMAGIINGTQLIVGVNGSNQEILVAANVTATTFQAIFLLTHAATDPVLDDAPAIYRLWDVSVTNLDQLDPNWQATEGFPRMYYEDELNVGQYGVYPSPAVTFPSNIWYSQRPPVTLALNSSVFVPDPLVYIPYYGMLARIFRKDGELRDPQREQYAQKRYDMGVEIAVRFLEGLGAAVSPGPPPPPKGGQNAGA